MGREAASSAALRSWRETGRYEAGIHIGIMHLDKLPGIQGCHRCLLMASWSWGCVRRAQVVSLRRPSPRQLESLGPGQQVTQHRLTCAREPRLFLVRAAFKAAELKCFQIAPQRMRCKAGASNVAGCLGLRCRLPVGDVTFQSLLLSWIRAVIFKQRNKQSSEKLSVEKYTRFSLYFTRCHAQLFLLPFKICSLGLARLFSN